MSKDNDLGGVRKITISEDEDGQRLDRWLKKTVPELPYGLVQKLIRKGQLRIDGKRAKSDTKLSAGQEIRIPPTEGKKQKSDWKPKLSAEDRAYIKSLVIHDDGDVIAINKPAGLAVQGGTNMVRHIDGMLDGLIDDKDPARVRPRLVHRLDKDTSGVLLLARSAKVAKELGYLFKGKDIKKIYYAITSPTPQPYNGAIRAPLLKAGGGNKERMVVDEDEGKPAFTEYRMIENTGENVAFVAFWPRTGRTHQIRVHAEVLGCPVLGDNKYRGEKGGGVYRRVKQHGSGSDMATGTDGIEDIDYADRLHLHAARMVLKHPTGKGELNIFAPLPPELKKSWKAFGFDASYKDDPFADVKT